MIHLYDNAFKEFIKINSVVTKMNKTKNKLGYKNVFLVVFMFST